MLQYCCSEWLSLAAAALSVLIPPMLYTGTLMTENAFYPLFLLVAWALVATLERPTVWRQIGVLALCALAFATRQQAIAAVKVGKAEHLLTVLRRSGDGPQDTKVSS